MTGRQVERREAQSHTAFLENRSQLVLEGIVEVVSFDEQSVVLNTSLGALTIDGEGLHILSLSLENGRVTVSGTINGMQYENGNEKVRRGFFSRLVH